jgi:hypothetical protein
MCGAALAAGCAPHRPADASPARPGVISAAASPVVTAERWSFAGAPGTLIRTRSYRLFTTAADLTLVDEMPAFLEGALTHYTTAMGPLPRPTLKLDTFLMGDRPQWERLTRLVMGKDADTYLRIERGGFASGGRALLWTIGRHDTLAIAAHEGWHQYTQRTFRDELPAWLEEGIAAYMEGFVPDPAEPPRPIFLGWANTQRFDQLAAAAERRQLVPLRRLVAQTPQALIGQSTEATLTYYAQLWALVHFLRDGEGGTYRGRLEGMVSAAAAGRMKPMIAAKLGRNGTNGADAFRAYFGADFDRIGAEYEAFIAAIIAPGARERIERGESPLAQANQ